MRWRSRAWYNYQSQTWRDSLCGQSKNLWEGKSCRCSELKRYEILIKLKVHHNVCHSQRTCDGEWSQWMWLHCDLIFACCRGHIIFVLAQRCIQQVHCQATTRSIHTIFYNNNRNARGENSQIWSWEWTSEKMQTDCLKLTLKLNQL